MRERTKASARWPGSDLGFAGYPSSPGPSHENAAGFHQKQVEGKSPDEKQSAKARQENRGPFQFEHDGVVAPGQHSPSGRKRFGGRLEFKCSPACLSHGLGRTIDGRRQRRQCKQYPGQYAIGVLHSQPELRG